MRTNGKWRWMNADEINWTLCVEFYWPVLVIRRHELYIGLGTDVRWGDADRYTFGYRSAGLILLGFGVGVAWRRVP